MAIFTLKNRHPTRIMKENVIREIRSEEIPLLNDFLYEAIFIPEGVPAPPRSIIENEDLRSAGRSSGPYGHGS